MIESNQVVLKQPGLGITFNPNAAREHRGEPKNSHNLFDEEGTLKRP